MTQIGAAVADRKLTKSGLIGRHACGGFDMASALSSTGVLVPGVRVSIELPEAGACVARVSAVDDRSVLLELLDDLPEASLELGATVDLFLPSGDGVHRWLAEVSMEPDDTFASVELVGRPLFIQRRLEHRIAMELPGAIRRVSSTRRGRTENVRVLNLSHGGLKLAGPSHLHTGDTVEITLNLDAKQVVVTGRVVMTYAGPASLEGDSSHVSFLDDQTEPIAAIDTFLANADHGILTSH